MGQPEKHLDKPQAPLPQAPMPKLHLRFQNRSADLLLITGEKGPFFVPGLGAVREQGGAPGPGYIDHDPEQLKGTVRSIVGLMRAGRLSVIKMDGKNSQELTQEDVIKMLGEPAPLPKLQIRPGPNEARV